MRRVLVRQEIGGGLGQAGLVAMAGGPIGLALTGGQMAAGLIINFLHPSVTGMQAQDATTLVNGIEVMLQQNLNNWNNSDKSSQSKAAALYTFDQYWGQIVSGCSQFAGPGTKCVNDRMPGGKFDWFKRYRDPIANAGTNDVPSQGTNVLTNIGTTVETSLGLSSGMGMIVLLGGLLLLVSSMGKKGKS
jgi:hypothetical protein